MKSKLIPRVFPILAVLLIAWVIVYHPDANPQGQSQQSDLSAMIKDIFELQNLARTDPKAVAKMLEDMLPYFRGNILSMPGEINLMTREGASAVKEAADFLNSVTPVPALGASRGMSFAARDHVVSMSAAGKMGHYGPDGSSPFVRLNKYGKWVRTAGENISCGAPTGKDVVLGLITDDGVANRGHRTNIFNKNFTVTGIACGRHPNCGIMCTIDYAGGFNEK